MGRNDAHRRGISLIAIYVLPTEESKPPQAWLIHMLSGEHVEIQYVIDDDKWVDSAGEAIEKELGDLVTDHARNLGVFQD
jgi:hypothetical protein